MLIGRYPAVLDACVLHSGFLRAGLLWYAHERLFQPRWSDDILREWEDSLKRRFSDDGSDRLRRQRDAMATAFPDALIQGYQPLTAALSLPDVNDRHVLAAAIAGRCSGIITANLRHFPEEFVGQFEIEVVHPDEFVVNIIDLDQDRALSACRQHRLQLKNPAMTAQQFLDRYKAIGLIQAYQRLLPHIGLL